MDPTSSPSLTSLSECESIAIPSTFQSQAGSKSKSNPEPQAPAADSGVPLASGCGTVIVTAGTSSTAMDERKPAVPEDAGRKSGKESRRNSRAPATNTDTSHMLSQQETPAATGPKQKRVRKRKDDEEKAKPKRERHSTGDKAVAGAAAAAGKDGGEPKPRRQRNSNVKAQDGADAAAATAASRKKAKLEHTADETTPSVTPRQAKITDMVSMTSTATAHPPQLSQQQQQHQFSQHPPPQTSSAQPSPAPTYSMQRSLSQHSPQPSPHHPASYTQRNGAYEAGGTAGSPYAYNNNNTNNSTATNNAHHAPPPPPPQQAQPASLPRSSGQNYDPIRSAIESSSSVSTPAVPTAKPAPAPQGSASFSPPPNTVTPPPRPAATPFRASASPAISSIIDPPAANSTPAISIPPPVTATSDSRPALSPTQNPANGATESSKPSAQPLTHSKSQDSNAMDIDSKPASSKPGPKKNTASSTGNLSSGALSPKPTSSRNKEPPRPLPSTGSGLLSNALFGGDANSSSDTKYLPNIILNIPIKGKSNLVINFARMAEEQYGFDALHPRIAAQKERRARLAAASAVLEKSERAGRGESGAEDDLSLDVDRDSDGDGDVNMSGMGTHTPNGTGTDEATTAPNPNGEVKKTRRRKIEEYDRDDPFVDDSELIWEEQAAACKDGFFVYSGLLVQEGDKVSVEKADGTTKRGRGRRGGASGTTHGNSGTSSRGRGGHAGSSSTTNHPNGDGATAGKSGTGRGGARKPRITKADRLQMEKEKVEREKMAIGLSGKAAAK
ncbi:HUN domain-containing protein [Trichophyton interdigitale]|nr:HUN domain-containing protein [Trichophyton interdigitale]KAG5218535.1 HUN domain-containing protein [Trichophyton interdigitale]KAG8207000.1 HUN domain-containing protein [Trichophyton interdigitale]